MQTIQKKNQLSLHPAFFKVALLKNSPCLLNAFKRYKYYFLHEIATIGRTYIEMNVYCWNSSTPTEHDTHFTFDIHPIETKAKQFKLILNSLDIMNFFEESIPYEFKSHHFINLARKVLSKFTFYRHYVSKRLKISSLNTPYGSTNPKPYILQNNLNPNNFDNNLKLSNFLEMKYYEPKIVLQQVKRYQKIFLIFTIEYLELFDFWNIKIYNPKSSRTFMASISLNNFLDWHIGFYEKVYPSCMDDIDLRNTENYQHYCSSLKIGGKQATLKRKSLPIQARRKSRKFFQFLTNSSMNEKVSIDGRRILESLDRICATPFLNPSGLSKDSKKSHNYQNYQKKESNISRHLASNQITENINFHEIKVIHLLFLTFIN